MKAPARSVRWTPTGCERTAYPDTHRKPWLYCLTPTEERVLLLCQIPLFLGLWRYTQDFGHKQALRIYRNHSYRSRQ